MSPRKSSAVTFVMLLFFSVTLPNVQAQESAASSGTSVNIQTDKASYVAGEVILVNIMVQPVKPDEPTLIVVLTPQSYQWTQERLFPDGNGMVRYTFALPEEAPTGTWRVSVTYIDAKAEATFSVSKVEQPAPAPVPSPPWIKVSSDKSSYIIGENAMIRVEVGPVSGVSTTQGEKIIISIIGSDGRTYFSDEFLPNDVGFLQFEFVISKHYPLGQWTVRGTYISATAEQLFTVKGTEVPTAGSFKIIPNKESQSVSAGDSAQFTLKIIAPSGFNKELSIIPRASQNSKYLDMKLLPPINVYDADLHGYRDVSFTVTPSRDALPASITIALGLTYMEPVASQQVILDEVGRVTINIETYLVREPTLKREFVLGEVLVRLGDNVDPSSEKVRTLIDALGGKTIEAIKEINLLRISVAKGTEQNFIEQVQKSELVKFAGKNKYLVPAAIEVHDPDFSKQVKNYEMIDLPNAWSISMGRSEVIVAVLDSGVDLDHPDLKANIWSNDDSCDDGLDNDSNGFVDDCNGWNFAQSNNNAMDEGGSWPECDGHGTHVSGIIAARNNEDGGVGVAPHATIMPIKISGNEDIDGQTVCVSTEATVAEAVIYAADNGAKVINASLGCPNGEKCDMPALGDAFQYASKKGVLIVVAAGNERETSEGMDDWQDYAQYLIEVSSVDLSGELASYSNLGPGIKLSAPGTTVFSTKLDDRYGIKTGTSQAAPMVSGCAALLLSANPSLINSDLERILKDTAKDIGDVGRDNSFGYGLLDCNEALKSTKRITIQEQPTVSVAIKHKKKVTLVSAKSTYDEPIFGLQLNIMEGAIKFVKARGWDRERIDQSTVIVKTTERPIKVGGSLIIILIVDNKSSGYEWKAFGNEHNLLATGSATVK